jgi:hypothetical protein
MDVKLRLLFVQEWIGNRNDTTFAVFVRKEIIRGCGAEFFGKCLIRNDF